LNTFKKLAGDTVIYGMSSIIGRFLNWWLVPYYSFLFLPEVYGVVTNLYSYVAFFMVLLTYGMETGYFRFASGSGNSEKVYSTSMVSLFSTSLVFLLAVLFFKNNIAALINYPEHSEYILWLAIIVCIDAFTAIPFAHLRLRNKSVKFATIKLINIGFGIGLNLFFLSFCPLILKKHPDSIINLIYSKNIGVGYVFISNLLASVITLLLLSSEIMKIKLQFDRKLLIKILNYSFPILIVGLAGMVNQNIDKILIPFLIPEYQHPMRQLGIYGANYKLAVLMNMFIQAFRYAFEPFFFSRVGHKDDPGVYATVMKYFIISGLFIFLGMMLYIDVIKLFFSAQYREGLKIVPLVLLANLFFGVYFTLSLWYKLKDMTRYGAYMAIVGALITIILNIILIPKMGYMGSAIAVFTCFFTMMVISYILGQKYYPVPYDLKTIAIYFGVAMVLFFASTFTRHLATPAKLTFNTLFLFLFLATIWFKERKDLLMLFKVKK